MLLVSSPQRILRLLCCVASCLGLIGLPPSGLLAASTEAPAQQITQLVDSRQRIALKGNLRPLPRQARDLGEAAAATPASRLLLLLKRSPAQQVDLEQFLADVHSPGTPRYHQWLTPAQFGTRFGPADSDLQAIVAWLQSQGLAVDHVNPARTAIEFSGTNAQLESAFATRLHSFDVDGEQHIANITDPQIPLALAPVVAGISPLNDFRLRPLHTAPHGQTSAPGPTSTHRHAIPFSPPALDTGSGHYDLSPADVATIYDLPNSALNTGYTGTNLIGTGVTIGIAGASNVDLTNVTHYRQLFGLPALTPKIVIDGADPGVQGENSVEALLDLEVASAVAPGADLTLYISQSTTFQDGLFLAIQRALDDDAVNVLNVSFGQCEAYEQASGNQQILNYWQQAAAQGISVTVSTGDSGSAGCDLSTAASASEGLQVNALASTPYDIAVGGTDFNQTTANESQYWNSGNAPNGESARGYIPEIAWNNSTSTTGSLSGNVPNTSIGGTTNIEAAGGGVSGCFTATQDSTGHIVACSGGYPKPAWQSSFGSLNGRQLPDVSLFSANGGHDSAWVVCASGLGADAPGDVDCVPDPTGAYRFQEIGGTSASSPAFAGVLSLVIQQLQHANASTNVRLGQANYTLYPLAKQHPTAFHDVSKSNISVVCTPGTLNCGANGFLAGYDSTSAYDPATGLGSVDIAQLVQNWSNITFQPTTTALELSGSTSPITITHGTAVNVTATVTSSSGTPTGTVALVAGTSTPGNAAAAIQGTVASPSVLKLTNGTITEPYPYLPGGSYNLLANYSG
ncbi:MAG: hypothetical protein JWM54_797, partial [Acidobacteriaceae bacterium]|nr:hypothetical protein [Acidobacteriaceae bacterium]